MKIVDVTLTLLAWEGLQPVKYSAHVRSTRTGSPIRSHCRRQP